MALRRSSIRIKNAPLKLSESGSLTSITGYNENRALFDPQSFNPELHVSEIIGTK